MTHPSKESSSEAFSAAFGAPPTVVVRAPGRVNLIGEHTDYSLLPVLPIAIDRSLFIAADGNDSNAIEAISEQFEERALIDRDAPSRGDGWSRYLGGVLVELRELAPGRGARIHVSGDLPSDGGLSSSSALTVGVLSALSVVWNLGLDTETIVRLAVAAERHVGVETGGMDQAVIAFGRPGTALRIDFHPAGRRFVRIPEGLRLVVAYSGEAAPKGSTVRDQYNERVVGARLAAAMLADQIGLDVGSPPTLSEVADVDVVDVLVDDLPEKTSAQEVAHGAQVDVQRLVLLAASSFNHITKVPVRRVARHILSEAQRVNAAEAALNAGDLAAFGELMDESHDSLRQDFKCSTTALDKLCAAMRKAGAFGARLTGAGFGGYALAVVLPEKVETVMAAAVAATGGPAFEVVASGGVEAL